jgi:hypothetical protein
VNTEAPTEAGRAAALADAQSWYRGWRTAELLAEAEALRWEYAELRDRAERGDDDPTIAAGLDYLAWKLVEAAKEVERRERLRARPESPPWPGRWPDVRAEARRLAEVVDVAAFASGYLGVELRPGGGGWLVGRCPLPGHDDGSPSFTVYPGDRGWYCFGCGRGGILWTLLFQTHPHLAGYADAVALLRGWSGSR